MMRLFNPANERYENSYSYQSAYARPEYSFGLGQDHSQHYYESQFQNQSPAFAPASHAFSGMMQQSSHFNSNSGVMSPAFGSFPMKPVEQHSSSHAYSQHGSSYGLGQQGAFGSAQYGSYGMRKQGGIGGLTKHGAYSSHESYGSAHNGLLGPVQQSYGSSQHGSYSSGNHGAHNLGHHGSFSSAQHGTFGSATHTPSTNWAMNRRQKSSYYRRSNNGFRSGDSSDSEEEEEEEESENEHEHH
uniref:Uncharacterized protein n=1 Tax=Kalanchoe fedtschenkoi TaxID=63787 RepID=A0A7N0V9H9_KALFE